MPVNQKVRLARDTIRNYLVEPTRCELFRCRRSSCCNDTFVVRIKWKLKSFNIQLSKGNVVSLHDLLVDIGVDIHFPLPFDLHI